MRADSRTSAILLGALVCALGFWVYWPCLQGGWIWDDYMYVADNPALRSLAGLRSIWLSPGGVNYFPVTATVQWVQWHLWGDQTLGYHLTNLALHLAGSVMLGLVVRRLARKAAPAAAAGAGWIAALLFAVHPLAVESVAWISEIKNVLSLALLLAAALSYLTFERAVQRRGLWYASACALFLLAMLSKSTVAPFPAALLLYAGWKNGRVRRADWLQAAPFAVVALGLGLVTIWFEHHRTLALAASPSAGLGQRISTAGIALPFYLWKSLLPFGLMPNYPAWNGGAAALAGVTGWIFCVGLTAFLWMQRSPAARTVLFAWGLFVLALAPVIGLIPMAYLRIANVADHFAYLALLPVAGLAAVAAASQGFVLGPQTRPTGGEAFAPRARLIASGLGLAAIAIFTVTSRSSARIYRSEAAFWTYAAAQNPRSWTAQNNLALVAFKAGRTHDAIEHYEAELKLKPDDAAAHSNLATLLSAEPARAADAIEHFESALRLKPELPGADNSLANLLAAQPGRSAEAIAHYETALRLDPNLAAAHNNLAGLLSRLPGRQAEVLAHYRAAVRLAPDFAAAHANLGLMLSRQPGGQREAVAEYETALRLDPTAYLVHYYLGCELVKLPSRSRDALQQFAAAARLNPDFAPARQAVQLLESAGR